MAILTQALYNICHQQIVFRIDEVKKQIEELRDAANNETKSSAGDKYETSREMMQQEINKSSARLLEIQRMKATLDTIQLPNQIQFIQLGNVVKTNNGNYFLSVSLGAIKYEEVVYHAISLATPLAQKLVGLKIGDKFTLNNKVFFIETII